MDVTTPTPLEIELIRLAAPIASSILAIGSGLAIAAIKWYWGSVVKRMDSIASAVSSVEVRLGSIEHEMRQQIAEIRSQTQHRDDVMAGNVAARLENLGSDEAPALRLIITNDPAPEFKRENGRIEVAVP